MRSYPDIRFETERLIVRAWSPDDAEDAYAMYGDPIVVEFLTGTVEESVETQRTLLGKIVASYRCLGQGLGSFATESKETGRVIGCVLLKPLPRSEDLEAWSAFREALADPSEVVVPPPVHEIEIGWHLARGSWGRGYATEAAKRVLDYGFDELCLDEIHAVLFRANKKSARVAERLGLVRTGTTEAFYGHELEHYVSRRDGRGAV
ncbi:MAG: GNAT family N-acetyltransferase [Armatimonadetes bacterium]|nr:GNAT family N-acetyltransferase [Armatimonadota bacterium]